MANRSESPSVQGLSPLWRQNRPPFPFAAFSPGETYDCVILGGFGKMEARDAPGDAGVVQAALVD